MYYVPVQNTKQRRRLQQIHLIAPYRYSMHPSHRWLLQLVISQWTDILSRARIPLGYIKLTTCCSGSMTDTDRLPLPNTPVSPRLVSSCNNRYGAVLSALYGFWLSRDAVALSAATQVRQDAYSIVTFNESATIRVQNDFTSSTDQLISQLLPQASGGTNFHAALLRAQSLIQTHWSSDRAPVIIFLSDGECNIGDDPVYDLCRMCVQLGKALAFHSVSFGIDTYSASLRRMAEIAHEVFASAPQDVLTAGRGNPCGYANAIDSAFKMSYTLPNCYNPPNDPELLEAPTNPNPSDMPKTHSHCEKGSSDKMVGAEEVSIVIPNLFRLLDLVQEGSGGIKSVEKVVIDQPSLHRLLNIVQPGSYESVSRINLKALDQVTKPDHLALCWLFIAYYAAFHQTDRSDYLGKKLMVISANLLSCTQSDASTSALRSGLYLALDPSHQDQGASKVAYIIYWPEDTTWDDQAASSSLILTQARAFIWDTNTHDEDRQGNDDNTRLFDFEVAKSLEQEEDATGSPGFTVTVDPRLLPQANDQAHSRVRLVPGEQKAALLVTRYEEEQHEAKRFEESISLMNLRRMIESKDCPLRLGNLTPTDLEALAAHGLRNQHRAIFAKYDEQLRGFNAKRAGLEGADKRHIEDQTNRDRLKLKEEIQHLVRIHYDRLYPSPRSGVDPPHGVEDADKMVKKEKPQIIQDSDFQLLKGRWPVVKEYLEKNPRLSDDEHEHFINDTLRGSNSGIQDSGIQAYASSTSATNDATGISDPEFVSQLRTMGQTYFSLFGLIRRVYNILGRNLETLESKVLADQLERIVSMESQRLKTTTAAARDHGHREATRSAFEGVMQELREAMATNAQ
ncbi:von willebrand factor type A domain protein, partial [Rhizoctonia solani AG-3 Rhs1AP]